MNRRDVPTLRRGDDVPETLQKALDVAAQDDLPEAGRFNRIEANVLADATRTSGERFHRPLPSSRLPASVVAQTSGWRAPIDPRVRFAAAKIGLAALLGMGAAWSSVAGYQAYRAATAPAAAGPSALLVPRAKLGGRAPAATVMPLADETPPNEAPLLTNTAPEEPVLPPGSTTTRSADRAPLPAVALGSSSAAPEMARSNALGDIPTLGAHPPSPISVASAVRAPEMHGALVTAPAAQPAPGDVTSPDAPAPSSTVPPREARALEEDFLERATRALRSDPRQALAIAEEHRATFVSGRLAQEREVVAIQALAKLRQYDAARARARRFLAEHPESPYAKDVLRMAAAR